MELPKTFLDSLNGLSGFNKEAFEKVHSSGEQVTSIRINPKKKSAICNLQSAIPWSAYGFYLSKRPSFTFDPMFHAGCYYVQEASSMFLEQALKQSADLSRPLKILDLCAAPGGKSTHILSLISKDSLLVSNEVIKSRAGILRDNITKWGHNNVVVTSSDPGNYQKLEGYFDVIVVDAPCSGSGLFRREPDAIEEWSQENVELCSRRQKRILGDAIAALKKEGILIYCTCSYSKEENEDICEWLIEQFNMESVELQIQQEWGIIPSGMGYRFYPDRVKGEGFFLACFRKWDGKATASVQMRDKPKKISSAETQRIVNWVKADDLEFILHEQTVHAVPRVLRTDMRVISSQVHVTGFGTIIGEMIRDKVLPHHALAMSGMVSDHILRMELDYEQAIRYLKKKEINVKIEKTGWHLVMYEGEPLGWMNILPGRMNNYYPKELRILKD